MGASTIVLREHLYGRIRARRLATIDGNQCFSVYDPKLSIGTLSCCDQASFALSIWSVRVSLVMFGLVLPSLKLADSARICTPVAYGGLSTGGLRSEPAYSYLLLGSWAYTIDCEARVDSYSGSHHFGIGAIVVCF